MAEVTEKLARLPLKLTAVAPVKFVPLIVRLSPSAPLAGVKPVIVGGLNSASVVALASFE